MWAREPGQVRKEAALSGSRRCRRQAWLELAHGGHARRPRFEGGAHGPFIGGARHILAAVGGWNRGHVAPLGLVLALAFAIGAGCGGDSDGGSTGDVAVGDPGQNTLEIIGRIDQVGPLFNGYGYVASTSGLETNDLFGSGQPSEKTARLTFSFQTNLQTRAVLEDIFAVGSSGEVTFYFNDKPSGDFNDPESFVQGAEVASGELSAHNVITVYAPNTAISDTGALFTQKQAGEFETGGESHTFGEEDLRLRLALHGKGVRSNAILPRSVIDFAGTGTVVGQD
jgi:hypothetical protein